MERNLMLSYTSLADKQFVSKEDMEEMRVQELVLRAQQGNNDAMEDIIAKYKDLVYRIAWRYRWAFGPVMDLEAFAQEGYIGLTIAVKKYDRSKSNGCKFSTYAFNWIRQSMDNAARVLTKSGKVISLDELTGEDEDMSLIGIIADETESPEDFMEDEQYAQDIREAFGEDLTETEMQIVSMYHGFNHTARLTSDAIARELGISRAEVRKIYDHAIKTLRQHKKKYAARLA